jgi:hypothetical protein
VKRYIIKLYPRSQDHHCQLNAYGKGFLPGPSGIEVDADRHHLSKDKHPDFKTSLLKIIRDCSRMMAKDCK